MGELSHPLVGVISTLILEVSKLSWNICWSLGLEIISEQNIEG